MTKVFISHKQEDSEQAVIIANYLHRFGIDYYLDVLDNQLKLSGDQLTSHLRSKLSECSHLLAVLSDKTQLSWWVPFEIGLATEKDYPITSFVSFLIRRDIPEYLWKWPVLKSRADLDQYISLLLKNRSVLLDEQTFERGLFDRIAPKSYAEAFHRSLKEQLGQSN
ncbi:toll/interleukin-1 receptor domain-containing protein [Brevibacillus migulae]|uniref:toll/interleukin-1 receptor domain-containing protein n=1 Tax=Brevibacillus migulae TaxID=1644114 RepID=UPI00106E0315|nr:toll/interleukin-1 receptor domain-containing protein [Brevibacillus migulae]